MDVKKEQQQLICRGYLMDGDDDGILGPKTHAAIIKYQTDRSAGKPWAFTFPLAIDGIVGSKTGFRLDPPEIKEGNKHSSAVELCQEILTYMAEHGSPATYNPHGIDSDFGPKTLAAVKAFQKDHKDHKGKPLVVDGIVGPKTWCALLS
jgi:peptidoglycan hydrolase-like protein with peptidoglycan-binding domain